MSTVIVPAVALGEELKAILPAVPISVTVESTVALFCVNEIRALLPAIETTGKVYVVS